MQRWYTLMTKPRCEFKVAVALESQNIGVYVPVIEYHGKRGNLLERPFFPRYIFAHFDWESAGWTGVQWTPGLTRIVTFDGRPAHLPDGHVEYIYERLNRIDGDEFLKIKPGTPVRVEEGPFKDMEAIFAGHMNGPERVAILLEILGRETRVEVNRGDIKTI